MGIPAHLTCFLRNLYAGQEATVRTGYGATDWFQTSKRVCQDCILSPCLFNLYAEYIMWNAGLDEAQAGIKIAGRNINNLRYADDTTLMAGSKEELKNLLMKVKEEWKSWLKTQHSKNQDHVTWSHHFMANWWGNNGNSERLCFLGSPKYLQMMTEAMKLKDVPWEKSYDQPRQHIKKQRHYFANKGPSSQGFGFSNSHVWMWELDCEESWALKNWCFWTVVLEKTLESPWNARRSN